MIVSITCTGMSIDSVWWIYMHPYKCIIKKCFWYIHLVVLISIREDFGDRERVVGSFPKLPQKYAVAWFFLLFSSVQPVPRPRSPQPTTKRATNKRSELATIKRSELDFGEQLGMGASATVYKGIWKTKHMTVAIKSLAQRFPDSEVWFYTFKA